MINHGDTIQEQTFAISANIKLSIKNSIDELEEQFSDFNIHFMMGKTLVAVTPELVEMGRSIQLQLKMKNVKYEKYTFSNEDISISNVPFFDTISDRYIEIIRPEIGKIIMAHFLAYPYAELNVLDGDYKEGARTELMNNLQLMPLEVKKYRELCHTFNISLQQAWNWIDEKVLKIGSRLYSAYSLLTYVMNSHSYQQFSYAIIGIENLIITEGKRCRQKKNKIVERLDLILELRNSDFRQDIIDIYDKRNDSFHEGLGAVDYYSEDIYVSDELIHKTIAIFVYLICMLIENDAIGFDFTEENNYRFLQA